MGDPTGPTRPLPPEGQPPERVAREREAVYAPRDDSLVEELRRIRFWSYFGSAVAVAASILALIALIAALGEDDGDGNGSRQSLSGIRSDVSDLRSDASRARSDAREASDKADSLEQRVEKLEQSAGDQGEVSDQIEQLQQDLSDLSDRVDQVERAQEDAAAGGP